MKQLSDNMVNVDAFKTFQAMVETKLLTQGRILTGVIAGNVIMLGVLVYLAFFAR